MKHPLYKEWELMRRILVEVGKPSKAGNEHQNNEGEDGQDEVSLEGISLHYHPKVRMMPLRYVKIEVEIVPGEEHDKGC